MKRVVIAGILLCALLLSACGSDQKVKKDEVMVDSLNMPVSMELFGPIEIGSVELVSTDAENLVGKTEWAFQHFLNMPMDDRDFLISISFQSAKQMELEWERLDEEVVEEIKEKYPDAVDHGYYIVSKTDANSQLTISGKFEGKTQQVLELTNPFWEDGLVTEPMNRKETEKIARAYVIEHQLTGGAKEPLLKEQYRYLPPGDEAEWFWFRYESPENPENQVLMAMRGDTTQMISFHTGYMAMVAQNEMERFAERVESE